MRKLLAIAVMSGALILSASAAFAGEDMSSAATLDQGGPSGGYWVDPQGTLLVPDTQPQ